MPFKQPPLYPAAPLLFLALLALAWAAPAPEAQAEDDGPRFYRCDGPSLYGEAPGGTEVELFALHGPGRNVVVVPENARYIFGSEVVGPLVFTSLPPGAAKDLGGVAIAVTPPGLPLEDLPLPPVPQGEDPLPWATQALTAIMDQDPNNDFNPVEQTTPIAHLALEQDYFAVDVLLYNIYRLSQGQPYPAEQYVVVNTPRTFQRFSLGCDNEVFKLFRLDGTLYLMTDFRCCDCGAVGIDVHAFQQGQFVPVYGNYAWSN